MSAAFDYAFLVRMCQEVGIPPDEVPFTPSDCPNISTARIRFAARWITKTSAGRVGFLALADRIDALRREPHKAALTEAPNEVND